MIGCEDARRLIVGRVDGTLSSPLNHALDRHLAVCGACREAADTQHVVSSILRHRPDEPMPAMFWSELSERLDAARKQGWGSAANWRAWSLRLVPVAAAAAILAFVVPQSRHARSDGELSTALVSLAVPPGGLLALTAPRADDDSAMVVLLANEWWQEERP